MNSYITREYRQKTSTDTVVFIDRDDTLVRDLGTATNFLPPILNFALIKDLRKLNKIFRDEVQFVIVSNQSRISKNEINPKIIIAFNFVLVSVLFSCGIKVSSVLICPHKASDSCECRKPGTKMIKDFVSSRGHAMNNMVVGNSASDLELGWAMGYHSFLVKSFGETAYLVKKEDQLEFHKGQGIVDFALDLRKGSL